MNTPLPHGIDTCRVPFVWGEACPGDVVCVTTGRRDQASFDNAHADERFAQRPVPIQDRIDGGLTSWMKTNGLANASRS